MSGRLLKVSLQFLVSVEVTFVFETEVARTTAPNFPFASSKNRFGVMWRFVVNEK